MSRKNFADVLRKRLEVQPGLAEIVDDDRFRIKVSQAVFAARTKAGLTQQQLAKRVGTAQSVIARLEDTDYEGHSISMLRRIGDALGRELHVEFRNRENFNCTTIDAHSARLSAIPWEKALCWTPNIHTEAIDSDTLDANAVAA